MFCDGRPNNKGGQPDAAIVDCRLRYTPPPLSRNGHLQAALPALAVVSDHRPMRQRHFFGGYRDHLYWPIVEQEVKRRVRACISLDLASAPLRIYASHPMVEACCQHLMRNLADPATLDALSAKLGTNTTRLSREFQKTFGMGPISWLRKQRLSTAVALLESGEGSVQQIAAHVGYPDANNFSTAFRREFGAPPLRFKKTRGRKEKS